MATVQFGLEATVRVNIVPLFAMGFGTYQGLQVATASGCYGNFCAEASGASLFVSPVLYPAIFRLGEGGRHQAALGLMFPGRLVPSPAFSGLPWVVANYSVMF